MIQLRAIPMLAAWLIAAGAGLLISTLLALSTLRTWALGWSTVVALVVIGLAALGLGVWVFLTRTRRTERRIAPLAAVRVVVFAQASAIVGVLASGYQAGVLADLMMHGGSGSPAFWRALAATLAGGFLVAVGFVVQRLCRIPPEDEDDDDDDNPTEGAPGAA